MSMRSVAAFALPCLVWSTLVGPAHAQWVNHAPSGVASQSSIDFGGVPARAVDGSANGTWGDGSVTHTDGTLPGAWWQVAWSAPVPLDEIRLHNRADCCGLRLSNFRLLVEAGGQPLFTQDFFVASGSVPQGKVLAVTLPATLMADKVRVELLGLNRDNNHVLSLAEVQALEWGAVAEVNVAPLGVATQASTSSGGDPERGVDGNRDGHYTNGSVTHTADQPGNWWMVQLPAPMPIDEIRVHNRTDCCEDRLSNFRVSVLLLGAAVWTQDYYVAGGAVSDLAPEVIVLPPGTPGDAVRIELLGPGTSGQQILSLAEVEVIRRAVGLRASGVEVSANTGGRQDLALIGGKAWAGALYVAAGSLSGTTPGVQLNGFYLPLNLDGYSDATLAAPPPFPGFAGVLDARGRAAASVIVPPRVGALVGLTGHHAWAIIDPAGAVLGTSNAAPLTLVQ